MIREQQSGAGLGGTRPVSIHRIVAVLALICASVSACDHGSGSASSPTVTTTGNTEPGGASHGGAETTAARVYSTRNFAVPFQVTVPDGFDPVALPDLRDMVAFNSSAGDGVVIRFFRPVTVTPPGSGTPIHAPTDYLHYLEGLATNGANITDIRPTTIGGATATSLTASSRSNLLDAIGCTSAPDSRCYSLSGNNALHMVVANVHGAPLLAWLRTDTGKAPSPGTLAAFNNLISTVRFR
jgi:hypothetical protein